MTGRPYTMTTRAARADVTRARIVAAAQEQFASPDGDLTLDGVARAAGVSVRTVLRAFGSREGLVLAAIDTMRADTRRAVAELPKTAPERVTRLFDDYETIGDRVVRMLEEEHRIPGFAEVAAEGRQRHRDWVTAAFGDQLRGTRGTDRRLAVDALVAATDVYLWKLLRRDLGRSREDAERVVQMLVAAIGRSTSNPTSKE